MKVDMKKLLYDYAIVTLGTGIIAVAVYFFLFPNSLAVGSVSALALVLSHFIPLRLSLITLVLNMILLVIGFLFLGSDFGAKTVYSTALISGYLFIFEVLFPMNEPFTNDKLLETIFYIIVVSIGQAILFHNNASSGGIDIIAKMLNKFCHIEIGKAMTIVGMCCALSAFLISDTKTVMLSILGTYFGGVFLDYTIAGFTVKKRVCVLSSKPDEIADFILNTMHRGTTLYPATSGYAKKDLIEVVTIVNRNEYITLMDGVNSIDPKAFITVSSVNEVVGEWNKKRRFGK